MLKRQFVVGVSLCLLWLSLTQCGGGWFQVASLDRVDEGDGKMLLFEEDKRILNQMQQACAEQGQGIYVQYLAAQTAATGWTITSVTLTGVLLPLAPTFLAFIEDETLRVTMTSLVATLGSGSAFLGLIAPPLNAWASEATLALNTIRQHQRAALLLAVNGGREVDIIDLYERCRGIEVGFSAALAVEDLAQKVIDARASQQDESDNPPAEQTNDEPSADPAPAATESGPTEVDDIISFLEGRPPQVTPLMGLMAGQAEVSLSLGLALHF